ncbi:hypothetical protein EIN_054020 [Entamoeba invadens IP1]|uniref:hypothetical protein n=1 Tax=Entamoeba invadens IP1 TaxID=370355 RepID=UPI0002C3FB09|nr:hypothetical protein EIN_054020 [Entamoeba invadens IP1]ELP93137.1 hypothetical protein EIN_054020 [Entamoeba invadens IP1]|eukprot:XP_004259908.1 hypothetical protein EIN_054020 [Entamoeba invadens IP1]
MAITTLDEGIIITLWSYPVSVDCKVQLSGMSSEFEPQTKLLFVMINDGKYKSKAYLDCTKYNKVTDVVSKFGNNDVIVVKKSDLRDLKVNGRVQKSIILLEYVKQCGKTHQLGQPIPLTHEKVLERASTTQPQTDISNTQQQKMVKPQVDQTRQRTNITQNTVTKKQVFEQKPQPSYSKNVLQPNIDTNPPLCQIIPFVISEPIISVTDITNGLQSVHIKIEKRVAMYKENIQQLDELIERAKQQKEQIEMENKKTKELLDMLQADKKEYEMKERERENCHVREELRKQHEKFYYLESSIQQQQREQERIIRHQMEMTDMYNNEREDVQRLTVTFNQYKEKGLSYVNTHTLNDQDVEIQKRQITTLYAKLRARNHIRDTVLKKHEDIMKALNSSSTE